MTDTPKPGSPEAIKLGCICPVMDNAHGRGIILNGERVWWMDSDCPIHGQAQRDQDASDQYWESNTYFEDDA